MYATNPLTTTAHHWHFRQRPNWSRLRHRFWQPGGCHGRNLIAVETAQKMIDYIQANSVRRRLAVRPTAGNGPAPGGMPVTRQIFDRTPRRQLKPLVENFNDGNLAQVMTVSSLDQRGFHQVVVSNDQKSINPCESSKRRPLKTSRALLSHAV